MGLDIGAVNTSTHHLPGLVGPPPTDEQSRDASGPWAAVGARPEVRLSPRASAPLNFFLPRRVKMFKGPPARFPVGVQRCANDVMISEMGQFALLLGRPCGPALWAQLGAQTTSRSVKRVSLHRLAEEGITGTYACHLSGGTQTTS